MRTAVWVVTSPAGFFREMPKTGGLLEPLIFMVVMGLTGASLQAVFSAADLQPMELQGDALSLIFMFTLIIVVSGFVAAAIYFVIWKLMGSGESYETAYRCNAYISALIPISTVLNLIPYFAPAISVLLSTVYLVIASIYVHNLPSRRSWMVFGALGLIFLMVSVTGEKAMKKLREDIEVQKQFEEGEEPDEGLIRGLKDIQGITGN
jgi:hypothetical protein